MSFPEQLRYSSDHEWLKLDGDVATIGITDYAQGELGDVVFVELEAVGSALDKERVFGTVEAVKTVSELFMPVSGDFIEVDEALDANPELVNDDPYGDGWMIKVKVNDALEINQMMAAGDYAAIVSYAVHSIILSVLVGDVDGGSPAVSPIAHIPRHHYHHRRPHARSHRHSCLRFAVHAVDRA